MSAPLPTGTETRAGAGSSPRSTASVSSSAIVAGAGRDPRVVAVDEQLGAVLRGVGLRRGPGVVEVLADLEDLCAEGPHPGDLGAIGSRRANTTERTPSGPAAYATPCPKLPAEAHDDRPIGADPPSSASAWIATHVPRPLNERIGLTSRP